MGVFTTRLGNCLACAAPSEPTTFFLAMLATRHPGLFHALPSLPDDANHIAAHLRVISMPRACAAFGDLDADAARCTTTITISARGAVLFRMSWHAPALEQRRTGQKRRKTAPYPVHAGIPWTQRTEDDVLAFCERVTDAFRHCS